MKTCACLLLLSFGVLSCKKDSTTAPQVDQFAKWQSFGLHDYTIDQTRSCFCPNGGVKVRLTVRSDTVFLALRLSDSALLSYSEMQPYWSVDELFSSIRASGDSVVIRYNEQYGYPEYVDINPAGHPVDAGVLYETGNLSMVK